MLKKSKKKRKKCWGKDGKGREGRTGEEREREFNGKLSNLILDNLMLVRNF